MEAFRFSVLRSIIDQAQNAGAQGSVAATHGGQEERGGARERRACALRRVARPAMPLGQLGRDTVSGATLHAQSSSRLSHVHAKLEPLYLGSGRVGCGFCGCHGGGHARRLGTGDGGCDGRHGGEEMGWLGEGGGGECSLQVCKSCERTDAAE